MTEYIVPLGDPDRVSADTPLEAALRSNIWIVEGWADSWANDPGYIRNTHSRSTFFVRELDDDGSVVTVHDVPVLDVAAQAERSSDHPSGRLEDY